MHEQSETTQRPDGSWVNVYGRHTPQAGQPLPVRYPYEAASYPTVAAASAAAARRSRDEGRQQYDPAGPFPGQPLAHGGLVANIGPSGHDPASITRAVTLFRAAQHAANLAHRDRLRSAVAKQPIRPSASLPGKSSKKPGTKNSILPKGPTNPLGVNGGSGGRPGDSSHGTGPLGRNGTPSAGGMRVGSR